MADHERADSSQWPRIEWLLHPALQLLFAEPTTVDENASVVRSLPLPTLLRNGLTEAQFGWLLCSGYARLGNGEAGDSNGDHEIVVAPTPNGRAFFDRLRFQASRLATSMSRSHESPICEPGDSRPYWDASRRELRFDGRCVKRLRRPAPNQVLVLAVFQEEGWPPQIHDPLPPDQRVNSRVRLRDTIASLNQGQTPLVIRFSGDGTGEGVRWERVPDAAM